MPRVVHLAPRYRPHRGGVERHLELLNLELVKRGYRVAVITARHAPGLPTHEAGAEEVFRLSTERIGGLPGTGVLRVWFALLRLLPLLRSARLVHCHDYETFLKWYLPFRLLMPWKPVYVTFHGWEGTFPPRRRVIGARRVVEALARANLCIGAFIPTWYGTRADAISYGCVPPATSELSKRDRAVFVGRLASDTGLIYYLEGLALLQSRYGIRLALDVYGDGPLAESARAIAQGHDLDVSFHGSTANPAEHFASARFAFVSGYLAILEAMIHRSQVFAVYDQPLKRDYLAGLPAGTMIMAEGAEELCERLFQALAAPQDATRMIDAAQRWAEQQTPGVLADTYEELWNAGSA